MRVCFTAATDICSFPHQWLQKDKPACCPGQSPQPPPSNSTDKPGFYLQPNHLQLPKIKGGIAAATTIQFVNVVLQPFTLGSGNNSQVPTTPLIKLSFSLQIKRAAVGHVSGLIPLREGNMPWAVRYGDAPVQAISFSNAGITFKSAKLMTGKTKKSFIKPTTAYSFSLTLNGSASIACADGYGGSLDYSTLGCSLCTQGASC